MSPLVIRELRFDTLQIPFKVAFRHASAERAVTSSVWIEAVAASGHVGIGESCPRPYVTGETIDTARAFFSMHEPSLRAEIHDLATLEMWGEAHARDIDTHPAAWCAIELALMDALGKTAGASVEAMLGLPTLSGRFQYSAVLGDADAHAFRLMAARYLTLGFRDFKIKLSGDLGRDREKLQPLRETDAGPVRVRADANNLWTTDDEAIGFLRALDYPFFALEEPVRANQYAAFAHIADALDCRIILDESFVRKDQLTQGSGLTAQGRWILNIRVSKMGGLLRSLAIVEAARALGIGVIVGAQVGETSVLTRAGLTVAHAARDILIAQEGAFGTHLLERDVCTPTLVFGDAGILDIASYPTLIGPGLGLSCLPV